MSAETSQHMEGVIIRDGHSPHEVTLTTDPYIVFNVILDEDDFILLDEDGLYLIQG